MELLFNCVISEEFPLWLREVCTHTLNSQALFGEHLSNHKERTLHYLPHSLDFLR